VETPAVAPDSTGTWHIWRYAAAHAVLLSAATTQAGFKAELLARMPKYMSLPILYQTGKEHRDHRTQTAKYFTPTATHDHYLPVMERCADRLVDDFKRSGRTNLNELAARMAMTVAAEVIGLTNSSTEHQLKHLGAILHSNLSPQLSARTLLSYAGVQWHLLQFLLGDVMPAVRARRQAPRHDVISHLLAKQRKPLEILTECIMYAAAGMVTTQEFIAVGLWHCLQDPALRAVMLSDDAPARQKLLHELLRLEPVVGRLYRRTSASITVPGEAGPVTIPAGVLIVMHVYSINADAQAAGAEPLSLDLERQTAKGVSASVLSFGDGPHRCSGEFIALAESDVLMRRLLALDGLRIERLPEVGHNDITSGYELRDFMLTLPAGTHTGGA
jgi:cytochrome P450